MAGQNHKQGGTDDLQVLAMEDAHRAGSAGLGFMILSGHDSVTFSELGFYQQVKPDQMPVRVNPLELH